LFFRIAFVFTFFIFSIFAKESQESTFLITPNMGKYKFSEGDTTFYGLNLGMILDSTSRQDIIALDFSHSSDIPFSDTKKYDISLIEFDYLFNIYNMDFRMIDISRLWSEPDNKDLDVYALGGFGSRLLKDGDNGTDTSMILSLGVGMRYYWNRYMNMMAEYKNIFTSDDSVKKLTLGISFAFTPKANKEYLYDELDFDRDGVSDEFDKCKDTPLNSKVDVDGCLLDSDRDGISDIYDICPDTFKGFEVDSRGCKRDYRFYANLNLESVELSFDSLSDKNQFFNTLSDLAKFLKNNKDYSVELQGFTDNKKSPQYNKAYSQEKAYRVMLYLIEHGVERSRVSYRGYGEAMPIDSNDNEIGRANNRRVEAYIYKE
jgi:OOP family OmpA-OmpF porin